MKLSREKMVHLSHVVVDALAADGDSELLEPRNEVRLKIFAVLQDSMRREEQIEDAVRLKITSQKRDIPEGSREWDLLYRKYYEEEASKHRLVR